ncbi:MAG: hypothetical protein IKW04_03960 [Clostridia bacterium]|nr:hypothetical protein [Clostridia bacterium]
MKEKREKKKKTNRKKRWIILSVLLAVLLILVIGGIHIYRHNQKTIDAILLANQQGEDGLEQKHRELTEKFHETILALPDSNTEILNERDHRKLKEGELTPEQTEELFEEAKKRAEETNSEQSESSAAKYTDVDELIEEFYVLKAKYLTGLDTLIRQGKNEWRSKPSSEKTLTARFQMAQKCIGWGTALEAECDAEMNALLAKLETALIANGQDTSLVDEIRSIYEEEKQVKRAMLIEEYYPK